MLAFGRINIFGHLYYGRPAGGRETREINDKFDYGGMILEALYDACEEDYILPGKKTPITLYEIQMYAYSHYGMLKNEHHMINKVLQKLIDDGRIKELDVGNNTKYMEMGTYRKICPDNSSSKQVFVRSLSSPFKMPAKKPRKITRTAEK